MSDSTAAHRPGHAVSIQLAIAIAAFVLIAAMWVFTFVSMDTEEHEALSRAEGSASNLALSVEWQLNRQFQSCDQILQSLAAEWKADPDHFDSSLWRKRSAMLGDVSLQGFLLNAQGLVVASTQRSLIGVDLSGADFFTSQLRPRNKALFVGPAVRWKGTGRWVINLSRRLEKDDGSFAGAVVMSYDPWSLASLLEQVDLRGRGLVALVGSDGAVRALVSPGELRPGEDIGQSEMFQATARHRHGNWIGPSALDGVIRIHSFRRLRDQDLTIIIGFEREEALGSATTRASNAKLFAGGVTVAVLLMSLLLIREVSAARARELQLSDDRMAIEQAYGALEAGKVSAEAKTAQIEATLAGMSDGVMMLDSSMRLVQWNDRFSECTGVPRDLLTLGQPMSVLLRAQAMAGEFGDVDIELEVRKRVRSLREERGTVLIERTRPNGSTLELRRSRMPNGGTVTLYADITARKRAADAQEAARRLAEDATEQKSRFVAIVSHEIRTPLNAVVNALALLDESGLTQSQRRLADTARQASDALMALVNDILELSNTEAGRLAVRPAVFELRPVLDGVVSMFQVQATKRDITLKLDVESDVPQCLRADVGRMRQVLMNLVSNAVKFSDPGIVAVRASTGWMQGAPTLLFFIRDQGPVIADAEAAKLFQPFSRLENARASGAPGTGLGLAISERLVRLMGGQIGLRHSGSGKAGNVGNEFWLTFPLEASLPTAEPADCSVVTFLRRRRAAILLVEDIAANHLVTATLLRREGHRVDIAESGDAAIRMANSQPYDMIFMDLLMPGMSGYEATRRLRALDGPCAIVPIVALTANTAPEDRARCIAAGMQEMLGKPVRADDMFAMLARSDWTERQCRVTPEVRPGAGMDEGPLLDLPRLTDLMQGLPKSTLAALINQCLSDMYQRMASLREALEGRNPSKIETAAHALAGMAGTYGLAAMDYRMRRIIKAGKSRDFALAETLAVTMEEDLAAAGAALQSYLLHAVK